jgi:hypothetical protein
LRSNMPASELSMPADPLTDPIPACVAQEAKTLARDHKTALSIFSKCQLRSLVGASPRSVGGSSAAPVCP